MAAHLMVEFPISQEKIAFTGTSTEDTAYLKIFWKSIHLNPTIESRLVSSDVRQRIKPHANKSHEKQKFSAPIETPPELAKHHQKVLQLEFQDQQNKRLEQLDRREQSLMRLKKQEQRRLQVQAQSSQKIPHTGTAHPVLPPISLDYNDIENPEEVAYRDVIGAMDDIDYFDARIAIPDTPESI